MCRRRLLEIASNASSNSTSVCSTAGTGTSGTVVGVGKRRVAMLARLLAALARSCCAAWMLPLTSATTDSFKRVRASIMRLRRSLSFSRSSFLSLLRLDLLELGRVLSQVRVDLVAMLKDRHREQSKMDQYWRLSVSSHRESSCKMEIYISIVPCYRPPCSMLCTWMNGEDESDGHLRSKDGRRTRSHRACQFVWGEKYPRGFLYTRGKINCGRASVLSTQKINRQRTNKEHIFYSYFPTNTNTGSLYIWALHSLPWGRSNMGDVIFWFLGPRKAPS